MLQKRIQVVYIRTVPPKSPTGQKGGSPSYRRNKNAALEKLNDIGISDEKAMPPSISGRCDQSQIISRGTAFTRNPHVETSLKTCDANTFPSKPSRAATVTSGPLPSRSIPPTDICATGVSQSLRVRLVHHVATCKFAPTMFFSMKHSIASAVNVKSTN